MVIIKRVYPIAEFDYQQEDSDPQIIDIELERNKSTSRFERRKKVFMQIISNNLCNENISLKYAIYGIGSIIISILPTALFAIVPHHNIIRTPGYWYEFPLLCTIFFLPPWIAEILFKSASYINISSIKNSRNFLKLLLIALSGFWTSQGIVYFVWTKIANYRYPIPFNGYLSTQVISAITFVSVILLFPRDWRKIFFLKQRLYWLSTALVCGLFLPTLYLPITKIMISCPGKYQWIVAVAFPVLREFNSWILFKLSKRASDGDINSTEIVSNQFMSCIHAFAVCYALGTIATIETSIVILGIDFLINISICTKIIYIKVKRSDDTEKMVKLLQELIINEIVEFIAPLTYLVCLVICCFGPNADLIGNIGNDYWQYIPIDDLSRTVKFVFAFFLVDFGSLLVSTLFLWTLCRINLYRAYSAIQKEFGLTFTITTTSQLTAVS